MCKFVSGAEGMLVCVKPQLNKDKVSNFVN